MKYIVNIINQDIEHIKNTFGVKEDITPEFNNITSTVRLKTKDFNTYINGHKVYYYFELVNASIFNSHCCIFVYNKHTNNYHICSFYKSDAFDNVYNVNKDPNDNDYYILDDITTKISSNEYYKKFYCLLDTNNFFFFDDEKECILNSYDFDIHLIQHKLSKQEARLLYLENNFDDELNKLLEEKIKTLKEEITNKIESEKNALRCQITNFNRLISCWTTDKQKIERLNK